MVQTLSMKCPHCSQISDVFLSTNASVIILNCPLCMTPMLYFEKRIFPLSDEQIEDIRTSRQDRAVMRILQNIVHSDSHSGQLESGGTAVKNQSKVISSAAPGGKYITDDDITNLRIELETCRDTQEFIDSLE
ncbi:MAG: hypothetical protein ACLFQB_08975 [Chitinispirillaceae bacterium]